MTCFTVIVFQTDPPIDRFWPITSQLSYEHTSFGVLVYVYIYYFYQGACLFRVIHLEVYLFIIYYSFISSWPGSRRILTSTTSIFWAIIVDHNFMYSSLCFCISMVLFDPWSVPGLHHTQFMKTRPKDADS